MTDSRDLILRLANALNEWLLVVEAPDEARAPDVALVGEALDYIERPTAIVIGDVRFVSDVRREWHSGDGEEWRVTIHMILAGKRSALDWACEPTRPAAEAKAADMLAAIKASFAGGGA